MNQSFTPVDSVDLGASVAERFGKSIGPVERKLSTCGSRLMPCCEADVLSASLMTLSRHKPDRAKVLAGQIASKSYYVGEIAGLRLAVRRG